MRKDISGMSDSMKGLPDKLDDLRIWSVGHSTRTLAELVELMAAHGIEQIADVRRFPGSRRHPHFGEAELRDRLADNGIMYTWVQALGGRRAHSGADPESSGWQHPAFRAYAAHLATDEFAGGLEMLIARARARRTAMMCSEALWWRCHRRLIADVLVARGAQVLHIFTPEKSQQHALRLPARLVDGRLAYLAKDAGDGVA